MRKSFAILVLCFISCNVSAQSKDSISFFKRYHDFPVKYKLEHFCLQGKVKSFYVTTTPENEDNEKVIHEFDEKGNLIQIKNSLGYVSKKYNYNSNGKLISYTTKSKSMREFEVSLGSNGNVVQLIINNKEHGISTVVNEYNKNGYWTKQNHIEDKSVLQEYKYKNDIKLVELNVYSENKISESTKFSYVFHNDFVQIKLTSKSEEAGNENSSYIYVDYYGNEIYGFPFDNGKLNATQIKGVLANFKLDKNKNWIKNQEVSRVINYYEN